MPELGYGTNGFTYIAKGGTTNPALEAPTFFASIFGVKDDSDATKIARFITSGISTGTVRSFTLPNFNGTLATLAGIETLTNKTLTAPVINSPTGIVKSDVGLGNVDNTSDANKPVSTAQQTALDLKAPLASPTFTGTVSGITKSMVGLGNVDNTTDAGKPVSTAQQTALDLKANLISPLLVTPNLGTPSAGVLSNCTGLPISTGVAGLAAGIADFLGTPSSANLKTAVTDETGSGALVFANTPTLVTPILGTPQSGNLSNCTGLPQSGVTNLVSDLAGKQATLVNQTNIKSINGTSLLGSGDLAVSASPGGSNTQVQFNDSGSLAGDSGLTFNKTTDALSAGTFVTSTSDTDIHFGNASSGIQIRNSLTGLGGGFMMYAGGQMIAALHRLSNPGGVDGISLIRDGQFLFQSSTNNPVGASTDAGIGRDGAGVVKITDGTASLGGLKASYFQPSSLANAAAPNSSLYYSTDNAKLVWKDAGGTVRDLY